MCLLACLVFLRMRVCSFVWSVVWLVARLVGWLVGRLVGWLVGWWFDRLFDCFGLWVCMVVFWRVCLCFVGVYVYGFACVGVCGCLRV